MTTPRGPGSPLAYWPAIERSAFEHMTTADVWSAIRGAAAEYGFETLGVTLQDVNHLRSMAVSIRNQAQALEDALPSDPVLNYVAQAPYSPSQEVQNTAPRYLIRFEHTYDKDGQQETEWRSFYVSGADMPSTAGELGDLMDQETDELDADYGVETVGYASLSILAV